MNSSSTREGIVPNAASPRITTPSNTSNVIGPIFKNQAVIDYYSAPISQYVDLKEHKLILQDISEEEKDTIAALIACAIFFGDATTAKKFKKKLKNQNELENFKDIIQSKIKEFRNADELKHIILKNHHSPSDEEMYNLFCLYCIRFEYRHSVSPIAHPVDKIKALAMFKPRKEYENSEITLQDLLDRFKQALNSQSSYHGMIERRLNDLKKHQTNESISKLLKLFTDGKYLKFYPLLEALLASKNSKPTFKEIVLHNNPESFESAMTELKFNPDTEETPELMKLAIENGKTHAVKYFIKLGIAFELSGDLLFISITHQHNSIIHLYLQIKSKENNYQEILKNLFQKACEFGNLEVVKMAIEKGAISEDEMMAAVRAPIIDIERNPYGWEIKNYLTCKTINILVNKEELSYILIDLLKNAVTKEKIGAILPLLHHLRDNRKINILNLCGNVKILNALATIIDKKYTNNPKDESHDLAKTQLMAFFLKEDKTTDSDLLDLLQKSVKETHNYLLSFAITVDAGPEVINFLIDVYILHKIDLPACLLKDALEAHAPDKVIHKLLLQQKLALTVEANFALQCLMFQNVLSENKIRFQSSKTKDTLVEYLYDHTADPFAPFEEKSSVIDLFSRDHQNFNAIKCMVSLYQLYWDKISDILRDFVAPDVLNHLVMSYANNTPYFASVSHVTFFACKKVREEQAKQNKVGVSAVADQKDDAPNKTLTTYKYSS